MGRCIFPDSDSVILQCDGCGHLEDPDQIGNPSDTACVRRGDKHECNSCLLKRHAAEGPESQLEDLPY